MTRNRASAKTAGTRFETSIATWLATHVDDRIERRRQSGARDRGDLAGWRYAGRRIVAELKDHGGRHLVGPWLNEAEVERGNDSADVALVIAKRRGVTDPGEQVVLMTLRDLVCLLTGERPTTQTAASPSPVGDGAMPGPAATSTPAAGPGTPDEQGGVR